MVFRADFYTSVKSPYRDDILFCHIHNKLHFKNIYIGEEKGESLKKLGCWPKSYIQLPVGFGANIETAAI